MGHSINYAYHDIIKPLFPHRLPRCCMDVLKSNSSIPIQLKYLALKLLKYRSLIPSLPFIPYKAHSKSLCQSHLCRGLITPCQSFSIQFVNHFISSVLTMNIALQSNYFQCFPRDSILNPGSRLYNRGPVFPIFFYVKC